MNRSGNIWKRVIASPRSKHWVYSDASGLGRESTTWKRLEWQFAAAWLSKTENIFLNIRWQKWLLLAQSCFRRVLLRWNRDAPISITTWGCGSSTNSTSIAPIFQPRKCNTETGTNGLWKWRNSHFLKFISDGYSYNHTGLVRFCSNYYKGKSCFTPPKDTQIARCLTKLKSQSIGLKR